MPVPVGAAYPARTSSAPVYGGRFPTLTLRPLTAALVIAGLAPSVSWATPPPPPPPPDGETNFALASNGGVVFASSSQPSGQYPLSSLNNGDRTGAGWGTGASGGGGWNDATADAFPDWVRIKLPGYKTISRVVVYTLQDNLSTPIEPTDTTTFSLYGITDFQVQTWDGSAWVAQASIVGNRLAKRTIVFTTPISTTDIRIYVTGGLLSFSRIVEVEAFGVNASGAAPHGPDYLPPADPINTTFPLTSPNSGLLPFHVGQTFKRGQVFSTDDVVITGPVNYQIVAKSYWADGSCNFADIAGSYNSTANVTQVCHVQAGSRTSGAPITYLAIVAAAPTASVICAGLGTVDLGPLLASPTYTYHAGERCIQAMYATYIGTTGVEVRYFLRHWLGGRTKVYWQVTNGPLDDGAGNVTPAIDRTFHLTVIVDGATVFDSTETIYKHADRNGVAWVGGDPQVTALADPVQLTASKMVPNYARGGPPAETSLANIQTSYLPGLPYPYAQAMGSPGAQPQIGILNQWDALYPCSGDARAKAGAEIGSRQIGSFAFNWRSYASHRAPKPTAFAAWSCGGNHASNNDSTVAGSNFWDFNHSCSVGYLAYLLTGDAFHYERCMDNAALNYIVRGEANGPGLFRFMASAARGVGWSMRSVAQAAAIGFADDDVASEYKALLANQFAYLASRKRGNVKSAPLGLLYLYGDWAGELMPDGPAGGIRTFMQFYLSMALASIRDLGLFTGAAKDDADLVCDSYNGFITNLGGPSGDPTKFGFTNITAAYSLKIAADVDSGYYTDFGTVFANSPMTSGPSGPNTTVSNTLYGISAGSPADAYEGYWGYYLCALAYAVDQGYPGAVEAWRRIEGATNFSDIATSRFDLEKGWAIYPRVSTSIPSWRTAMNPMDVKTFAGTEPWSQPGFAAGSEALGWFAYSGGVVHQKTSTLFVLGAGHQDAWENFVWGFRCNQETPGWYLATPTTPFNQIGWTGAVPGYTHYLGDGRPSARHTYWALSSDETNDRIVMHGANAVWGNGNGGGPDTDALDLASGDYVPANTYTAQPIDPGTGANFAIGANNEMWHLGYNQHVYRWVPSSTGNGAPGVFTDFGDKGLQAVYEIAAGIDPIKRVLFRIGNVDANIPSNWFDMDASATPHAYTLAGDAAAIADLLHNRHHFVYDDAIGCMWVWRRNVPVATLYRLDITGTKPSLTFTVSAAVTLNGTIDAPDWVGNMGYGRFAYVKSLRGIIWVAAADKPVRFIATSNF